MLLRAPLSKERGKAVISGLDFEAISLLMNTPLFLMVSFKDL